MLDLIARLTRKRKQRRALVFVQAATIRLGLYDKEAEGLPVPPGKPGLSVERFRDILAEGALVASGLSLAVFLGVLCFLR